MSQFILLQGIDVTNANAVSGFTWGFPSPTHFLGFVNALRLKLNPKLISTQESNNQAKSSFSDIDLQGCAIFSHKHQVHIYQPYTDDKKTFLDDYRFSQKRGTRYMEFQFDDKKPKGFKRTTTPSIIEEAKMNMTVSLLINFDGFVSDDDAFIDFLKNTCYKMRMAGGSIFNIENIELYNIEQENDPAIHKLKRALMPAFALVDKSDDLQAYFEQLQQQDSQYQFYDAWLDCCTIKQQSRPKSDLIGKLISKTSIRDEQPELLKIWETHLEKPYAQDSVKSELSELDRLFNANDCDDETIKQWQTYINPDEKTEVDWEYQPKPLNGYIVPIMSGYKALSDVIDGRSDNNPKVTGARDNTTPVCFVESVHSVAEWKSVHRLNTLTDIQNILWYYQYTEGWYLCRNTPKESLHQSNEHSIEWIDD